MKKLFVVLAILVLIVGFGIMRAEAQTDTIEVTVTLQNLAVSVTPDTWDLSTTPTVPDSETTLACTATNNGNVNEDLAIAVDDSTNWTAEASAGTDMFMMDFSISSSGGPWTNITTEGVDLKDDLSDVLSFWLQFTAPDSDSVSDTQSIIVTVSASAS